MQVMPIQENKFEYNDYDCYISCGIKLKWE